MDNNTDALLEELKNLNSDLKDIENNKSVDTTVTQQNTAVTTVSSISARLTPVIPPFILTNDNLSEFILQKSQELILTGLMTVNALKNDVATTFDSKIMSGYAEIFNATTAAIDTLNTINVQNHKTKAAKEIKQLDLEAKLQITDKKKAPVTNNLNIIGSREEIMKMLKDTPKVIDVIAEVVTENSDITV